jgi:laminin alpha 3/5
MGIQNKMFKFLLLLNLMSINYVHSVILTPPYFNLVSNKKITASATCGEGVDKELYCKLTGSASTDRESYNHANLIQGQFCDICDSTNPEKSHHASFAIDGTDRWWQSPPLSRSLEYNNVNLTIDFGQVKLFFSNIKTLILF